MTYIENVCYLTQNGAESFNFMIIRGISAGALHILCGVTCGFGLAQLVRHRWLALTGTVGLLGFCVGFHGIYNLLVSAQGTWQLVGYLFPAVVIACLFALGRTLPGLVPC